MYKALHMTTTRKVMGVTVVATKKRKKGPRIFRKSTRRSETTVGHNKMTKVA